MEEDIAKNLCKIPKKDCNISPLKIIIPIIRTFILKQINKIKKWFNRKLFSSLNHFVTFQNIINPWFQNLGNFKENGSIRKQKNNLGDSESVYADSWPIPVDPTAQNALQNKIFVVKSTLQNFPIYFSKRLALRSEKFQSFKTSFETLHPRLDMSNGSLDMSNRIQGHNSWQWAVVELVPDLHGNQTV